MSQAVEIHIPDNVARDWEKSTGRDLPTLVEDAFALYVWALDEIWRGRKILSAEASGKSVTNITVPTLTAARTNRLRLLAELGVDNITRC